MLQIDMEDSDEVKGIFRYRKNLYYCWDVSKSWRKLGKGIGNC